MSLFRKPQYSTVPARRKEMPDGLYSRCPISGEMIYNKDLEKNLRVVPQSQYHFPFPASERIAAMLDPDSFVEYDAAMSSGDPLHFTASAPYTKKIAENQKKTGLKDAVISGDGRMGGLPLSIAVMEFSFLGASMGSVVGEKITRAIERATQKNQPVIIVSASGGARMYEGILSLMQMAKTSAALARHAQARLPYISILTNPTMAGVMASYATLGDVILAEPGALIGFAGPRVIKETTRQDLPKGFQTSEFLLQRGLIDQIVHRHEMRDRVIALLQAFTANRPAEKTA